MRPIDADALKANINTAFWSEIGKIIDSAPTIDAVEVVHGEWKGYNADKEDWLRKDGTPIFLVCNKCYGTVINNGSAHWNYCPNCGAKMDGERKGE